MLRGAGSDPAGHAFDSLADELLQVPAGAIRCQHGQIMDVDRRLFVQLGNLVVIDLVQPVIRGHRTGVGKDQSSQRVLDCRVLLDSPVKAVQIPVHQLGIIQHARSRLTDTPPLIPVQDIRLGHTEIPGLRQHLLHRVLDRLNVNNILLGAHQSIDVHEHLVHDILAWHRRSRRLERLLHCGLDLVPVKRNDRSVPLSNLQHTLSLFFSFCI